MAAPEGFAAALACHARAELSSALGDLDNAADLYAEAGEQVSADLDNPDLLPWRAGAAMALTHLRRHREAHELAETNLALARDPLLPITARAIRLLSCAVSDGLAVFMMAAMRAVSSSRERVERRTSASATLIGLLPEISASASVVRMASRTRIHPPGVEGSIEPSA